MTGLRQWLSDKSTLIWDEDQLYAKRARCVCGRVITGCKHFQGVPSQLEHVDDGTHTHADGTQVQHA